MQVTDAMVTAACTAYDSAPAADGADVAMRAALEAALAEMWSDQGKTYIIEHDGFTGTVIGAYTTREGKEGVVLQQVGTRVVHVYGRKWLTPAKEA